MKSKTLRSDRRSKPLVQAASTSPWRQTTVIESALPDSLHVRLNIKRILVPIDFSECSKQALRYALPFAKEFDASVYLLHVVQINCPSSEVADLDLALLEIKQRQNAGKQLTAWAEEEIGDALHAQTVVRVGEEFDEIIHVAETMDIDLIIISTHGRTGLARVFLGSTAEKVVRHAPCPVLILRQKEREFVYPERPAIEGRSNEIQNRRQPSQPIV